MEREDGISVIICCYNSSSKIEPTLEHLFHQNVSEGLNWEIILVDNNCKDDTVEKANSIRANFQQPIDFRVVHEATPGLMHARKLGIASSKYGFLLFVDDDNWIDSDYLANCYRLMSQFPETAVLGGVGEAASDSVPWWFKEHQQSYATGPQSDKDGIVPTVYGAGMCVRFKAWSELQNSGHQSILLGRTGSKLSSGEDNEMCYALRILGYDIRYSSQLTFKHDLPLDRLDWSHLRELYFGFGEAKARLDAYTATLGEKPIPKNGSLPFWFNRLSFIAYSIIPDVGVLLKSFVLKMEGEKRLLQVIGKLGQIKGIYDIRKDYLNIYQELADFKNSTSTMK